MLYYTPDLYGNCIHENIFKAIEILSQTVVCVRCVCV